MCRILSPGVCTKFMINSFPRSGQSRMVQKYLYSFLHLFKGTNWAVCTEINPFFKIDKKYLSVRTWTKNINTLFLSSDPCSVHILFNFFLTRIDTTKRKVNWVKWFEGLKPLLGHGPGVITWPVVNSQTMSVLFTLEHCQYKRILMKMFGMKRKVDGYYSHNEITSDGSV